MEPRSREGREDVPASNTKRRADARSRTTVIDGPRAGGRKVRGCSEARSSLAPGRQTILQMAGEVRRPHHHAHRCAQEGGFEDLRDGGLSLQGGWVSRMPAPLEQANAANSECRDRRNLSKKLPGSRFDRPLSMVTGSSLSVSSPKSNFCSNSCQRSLPTDN